MRFVNKVSFRQVVAVRTSGAGNRRVSAGDGISGTQCHAVSISDDGCALPPRARACRGLGNEDCCDFDRVREGVNAQGGNIAVMVFRRAQG